MIIEKQKKITLKIITNIFVFLFLISPIFVLANGNSQTSDYVFQNPFASGNSDANANLFTFVNKFVDFILNILAAVAVIFIIYSGFLFVTAQGDDSKITKAKKNFFWAVIGALVILTAKVLAYTLCMTAVDLGSNFECTAFNFE